MILNDVEIDLVKNKNIVFSKNIIQFEIPIDFNFISKIQDRHNLPTEYMSDNIIVINKAQEHNDFNNLQEHLSQIIYNDVISRDSCIFYSMSSGTGKVHTDVQDVHLISLYGQTTYSIYSENYDFLASYTLDIGDYLYIPKGYPHRSVSITPRIVLSVGFYP